MSIEDSSKPPFDFSKPRVEKYVTKVFYSCGCVAGSSGETLWACMHHRLPPPEYDESLIARLQREVETYRQQAEEALSQYLRGPSMHYNNKAGRTADLLEDAANLITALTENR